MTTPPGGASATCGSKNVKLGGAANTGPADRARPASTATAALMRGALLGGSLAKGHSTAPRGTQHFGAPRWYSPAGSIVTGATAARDHRMERGRMALHGIG